MIFLAVLCEAFMIHLGIVLKCQKFRQKNYF